MNQEKLKIGFILTLLVLVLLIGAWWLITRKRNIWYVYKSHYIIIAISILVVAGLVCCAVLFPSFPQDAKELIKILMIPILTGLVASVLYGLFSFENNIKFAETISQEVSGIVDDTCPYKVYPPVKERENNVEEDLLGSLINSNKYYYSGLGMTVASECIAKYVERKTGKGNKHNTDCITDMVFIIPNPNNPNPADSEKNNMVKEEMKKSFEKIYNSIRDLDFHLEVKFLVLPYRPPLHIHMTDTLCFWGLVDKYKNCPFPTTYCYRFSEGSESMYETIKHIFIQTEYQVARGVGKMVKLENDGNGKIECVAFTDRKEIKTIDGLINEMNIKNE